MSDHDPAAMQLKKMQDDITRLQSETDRMGERVDAMETRQSNNPRASDDRFAPASQSSATLSRPKLKVVRVEPGSDLAAEAEPDPGYAEADNSPRVVIQGEGKNLETRTQPAPTAAKSAPTTNKAPKSDKAEGQKAQKSDPAPSK